MTGNIKHVLTLDTSDTSGLVIKNLFSLLFLNNYILIYCLAYRLE